MNLLADESVDGPIVDRLRQDGHRVRYVAELAPDQANRAPNSRLVSLLRLLCAGACCKPAWRVKPVPLGGLKKSSKKVI